MKIEDSVAIVTGGGQGIGLAMSQTLLSRGARRVIVADSDATAGLASARRLNDQHGDGRCHFVGCDVTDKEQLRAAFLAAKELDGRVDIVANNAGVLDESQPSRMVDVNVKGVIWGSQLALEFMSREAGGSGGVVVNTASGAGLYAVYFLPVYSATKHAVVGFTGAMGSEQHLQRHGVRFNCLNPGFADTGMRTKFLANDAATIELPEAARAALSNVPTVPMDTIVEQFVRLVEQDELNGCGVTIRSADDVKVFPIPKPPY